MYDYFVIDGVRVEVPCVLDLAKPPDLLKYNLLKKLR